MHRRWITPCSNPSVFVGLYWYTDAQSRLSRQDCIHITVQPQHFPSAHLVLFSPVQSASTVKQLLVMLKFLNLPALCCVKSCHNLENKKSTPRRWGFVCSVFSVVLCFAVQLAGYQGKHRKWGEPSKWHEKHKSHSLVRNEASKSARADEAISMGEPTVFLFVTLFIL